MFNNTAILIEQLCFMDPKNLRITVTIKLLRVRPSRDSEGNLGSKGYFGHFFIKGIPAPSHINTFSWIKVFNSRFSFSMTVFVYEKKHEYLFAKCL